MTTPKKAAEVVTPEVKVQEPVLDWSQLPSFPNNLKLPALVVTIILGIFAFLFFILTVLFGIDFSRIFF